MSVDTMKLLPALTRNRLATMRRTARHSAGVLANVANRQLQENEIQRLDRQRLADLSDDLAIVALDLAEMQRLVTLIKTTMERAQAAAARTE